MVPTSLTADDARGLDQCLQHGGVALIPTDTVYGLACDPESAPAIRRLYALKGRPSNRPAAVMFFSLEGALEALPELGQKEQGALRALLPGPLTVLLPNRAGRYPLAGAPSQTGARDGGSAPRAVGSPALMGLRIPLLPARLAALAALRRPVMQSSANHSGGPETRRVQQVPEDLRRGVDLVLDGGALPGVASTVLDLSDYESQDEWRIAREGPLPRARLQQALG